MMYKHEVWGVKVGCLKAEFLFKKLSNKWITKKEYGTERRIHENYCAVLSNIYKKYNKL